MLLPSRKIFLNQGFNVSRHAFASRVDAFLQVKYVVLKLTVNGDGRGFITLELSGSEGLGVAGMLERTSLVGKVLEVRSQPSLFQSAHQWPE